MPVHPPDAGETNKETAHLEDTHRCGKDKANGEEQTTASPMDT